MNYVYCFSRLPFTVILTAALLLPSMITSLDLEGAKETACFEVESLSSDYIKGVIGFPFYYPMMSRLQLYRKVTQMSLPLPPQYIIEGSIYYKSCIRYTFQSESLLHVSGYGGSRGINFTLESAGAGKGLDFASTSFPTFPGGSGNSRVTLTDNLTFAVEVVCYPDNQMTWGVFTSTPELPRETVMIITAHVVSLGFSIEYFTELSYEQC